MTITAPYYIEEKRQVYRELFQHVCGRDVKQNNFEVYCMLNAEKFSLKENGSLFSIISLKQWKHKVAFSGQESIPLFEHSV